MGAINVLLKLADVFPVFTSGYEALHEKIAPLADKTRNTDMPDLLAIATAYKARLEQRQKSMKKDRHAKPAASTQASASSAPTSPRGGSAGADEKGKVDEKEKE